MVVSYMRKIVIYMKKLLIREKVCDKCRLFSKCNFGEFGKEVCFLYDEV